MTIASFVIILSGRWTFSLLAACAFYVYSNTFLKFSSLSIYRCIGLVKFAAVFSLVSSICKLGVLGFEVTVGYSTQMTIASLAAVSLVFSSLQAGVAATMLRGNVEEPEPRKFPPFKMVNRRRQKKLLLSNYGTGLVEIGHRELDVQLAALLGGIEQAGTYRLAKTIATTMLEALNPIVIMLLVDFARKIQSGDYKALLQFIRRLGVYLSCIGVSVAVAVACAAWGYFHWFAPTQNASMAPIITMLLTYTLAARWLWAQAYVVASGNPQKYLKASILGAVVASLLAIVLVPIWGAMGSTLSHVIGYGLTAAFAAQSAIYLLKDQILR